MRTRLLAAVAVFAAALFAPAAALADPVLVTPASPIVTKDATPPIDFTWTDDGANVQFQVVSGELSGGVCPSLPANEQPVSGIILSTDAFEYLFTPSVDGTACYYIEGFDGVTFTESTPVQITYDTTPPDGTLDPPNAVVRGTILLTATASDAVAGVDKVEFQSSPANANTWTTFDTDNANNAVTYHGTLDTTSLAGDGLYDLRVRVTDLAGNVPASISIPIVAGVLVDNTSPSGTLTSPGAVVTGTFGLTASASDAGAGVDKVEFQSRKGAGAWSTFYTDNTDNAVTYNGTLDTTALAGDGLYDLRVKVTDLAGNSGFSPTVAGVRIDNTAPSVSMTGPTSSSSVHLTATVSANASDGGSGVAQVEFFAQGSGPVISLGTDTTATSGSYSVPWNTTTVNFPDGVYTVWAVATDNITLTTTSAVFNNVRVDNAVPTVTLGGVTAPSSVRGTLNLTGLSPNGTGSAVASVLFGYRLGSSGTFTDIGVADTTAPYGVSFDTTSVADGTYNFQALITDAAGNTGTSIVASVQIDNHAPSVPGTPTGFALVQGAPAITFSASTDPTFGGSASGVDHYNVLRGGSLAGVVVAPTTSFTDNASLADGPYTYSVVAVDKAGNSSAASGGFQIFLDSGAHSAPTSVTAVATPTNQRPQMSWVAPTNAPFLDHYNVYRDSNPTRVGFAGASSTTFTDQSGTLTEGVHTYQVVAADASDTTLGVASGGVTILYDVTAPAAPTSVVASPALDGSIGVSWSAANDGSGSGIARYVVRRSLSSVPPASVSDGDATCQGTATSCTDATALNGKLYSYAVFAIDRAGNTSLAGVAPAVTASDQLAPTKPQGLTATAGDTNVALKWAAAGPDDDVAGYVLVAKQGTQPPGNETDGTRVCPAIVATSTTCVATGLTNGASYTFGLFALDEALNRSLPAVVTAVPNGRVTDAKAPAAVSKLRAKVSGNKVTLTWKNPADHDFDHVEITAGVRKPAALKASKRVYSGKGTTATTTLAPGQSRWFVVVAYDTVGNASEPAIVHVTIAAPSKFGPAPRAKVHGKVKLSWPLAKRAKYYNVQVYAGKKRILVSWPAGRALQLPRAKLKRGTTYTWYVWPGLGAKAKAHYGKLIGKNVFTFTG
jgi:fibronectin type 3 domain-containing protein